MLGRTQFSQKSYLVTESSDFGNKLIFMLPRVENIENPLHFWISALPEDSSQGIFQNSGKHFKIHFIFRSELSLMRYPKAYRKMVVNPRHISKLEQNSIQIENITFDAELGFRKEYHFHIPQVVKRWKMLKIHFISSSQLSLRSYAKAYLKMLGVNPRHISKLEQNSIQLENITFDAELRFRKEYHFHIPQGGKC
ncbi:hypothetical protein E2320_000131 [Naja naja]|nr:hypothetical protein E2320_000131 [Naja naja]